MSIISNIKGLKRWGLITSMVVILSLIAPIPRAHAADSPMECNIPLVGILLCPIVENIYDFMQDSVSGLIDNTIRVRFLISNEESEYKYVDASGNSVTAKEKPAQTLQRINERFTVIANILLAVAFLLIIYATAVGGEGSGLLSNYNAKKMLPRLVLIAIAINTSFYICAALVDVFNIAGEGVYDLVTGGLTSTTSPLALTVTGAAMLLAIVTNFGLFLLAVIAFFGLLLLRQILLAMCIVLSPIAFALWLFPNTDKFAKKWLDMFLQLLVIYPIVMGVYGLCQLVSLVVKGAF